MKKTEFMVLLLLLFCLAQTLPALCGDVDSNGSITIVDALMIAQYYVRIPPSNFDMNAADTNSDGDIDIIDALRVAQYYVRLNVQLNCPSDNTIKSIEIEANGFTFDALEVGPADGEPVLLLHGFPDTSLMWTNLMTVLAENGYHCLAPDQRGYSPGARPSNVNAYRYEELIADGFAFGSELGDRYHLIAHDWGANIAWLMLEEDPSPIASFTSIAVPHYRVWVQEALEGSDMAIYRWMLEIWMTPGEGEDFWTPEVLRDTFAAKPSDQTEATIAHMMEPGAMTAALNWYRASDGQRRVLDDYDPWQVFVPTLLIFGNEDMGQDSVADSAPLMRGPYRVVQPDGAHFIVDEQPEEVAEETLAHLQANPL